MGVNQQVYELLDCCRDRCKVPPARHANEIIFYCGKRKLQPHDIVGTTIPANSTVTLNARLRSIVRSGAAAQELELLQTLCQQHHAPLTSETLLNKLAKLWSSEKATGGGVGELWAQRAGDAELPKALHFVYARLLHCPGGGAALLATERAAKALIGAAAGYVTCAGCNSALALLVALQTVEGFLHTDLAQALVPTLQQVVAAAGRLQRSEPSNTTAIPQAQQAVARRGELEVLKPVGTTAAPASATPAERRHCALLAVYVRSLLARLMKGELSERANRLYALFAASGSICPRGRALKDAPALQLATTLAELLSTPWVAGVRLESTGAVAATCDEGRGEVLLATKLLLRVLAWSADKAGDLRSARGATDKLWKCLRLLDHGMLMHRTLSSPHVAPPPGTASPAFAAARAQLDEYFGAAPFSTALDWWIQSLEGNNGQKPGGPVLQLLCDAHMQSVIPVAKRLQALCACAYTDAYNDSHVKVARDNLLESSFQQLMGVDHSKINRLLRVTFLGEEGVGVGVVREWLGLVAAQLFDPNSTLFARCPAAPRMVLPSAAARVQPRYLEYFEFAGRVIALSLQERVPLGVSLAPHVWKAARLDARVGLEALQLSVEDMREVDDDKARSMQRLLDEPGSEQLGLTFSAEFDVLGEASEIMLGTCGGRVVTDGNKHEYVRELIRAELVTAVENELAALRLGLLAPFRCTDALALLSVQELSAVLTGGTHICVDAWRAATRLSGWGSISGRCETEPCVVQWLWETIAAMEQEQRATLLHFWTGMRQLPRGGFAELYAMPMLVELPADAVPDGNQLPLPRAATCFMQLTIPNYPSKSMLQRAVGTAMEHAEGYGEH